MEAIVPEVEELYFPEAGDGGGERAVEFVVTDIELEEEGEAGEVGNSVGEVVAVGVEEGKVGELVCETADGGGGEGEAVEIDAGDGAVVGVRKRVAAETLVVADVFAGPGLGDFVGIAGDGALEALDYEVSVVEPGVFEVARG